MSDTKIDSKPFLQLSGTDGNAFMIIGKCMGAARKAGMSNEVIDKMRTEMMAGDYDNLLRVASDYFEVA